VAKFVKCNPIATGSDILSALQQLSPRGKEKPFLGWLVSLVVKPKKKKSFCAMAGGMVSQVYHQGQGGV
jgi:hypothetical protein